MRTARLLFCAAAVIAVSAYLPAQTNTPMKIGSKDIGGVVSSTNGPEAGVWVVAETTDLPTRYTKEVVTDDRGRYLIPALPAATYTVFARGYGLVDSPKVAAKPGQQIDLKPSIAPDKKSRCEIISGELLVRDAERSREERVSRHRTRRQRNLDEHQNAGAVAASHKDG